jgi:hypothetical protein
VNPAETLLERAREYELLAAWHEERASVSAESAGAAMGFLVAAIVMRDVAAALAWDDEQWAA